jgi:hypothetical protein
MSMNADLSRRASTHDNRLSRVDAEPFAGDALQHRPRQPALLEPEDIALISNVRRVIHSGTQLDSLPPLLECLKRRLQDPASSLVQTHFHCGGLVAYAVKSAPRTAAGVSILHILLQQGFSPRGHFSSLGLRGPMLPEPRCARASSPATARQAGSVSQQPTTSEGAPCRTALCRCGGKTGAGSAALRTPVWYAVHRSWPRALEILLDAGASVDAAELCAQRHVLRAWTRSCCNDTAELQIILELLLEAAFHETTAACLPYDVHRYARKLTKASKGTRRPSLWVIINAAIEARPFALHNDAEALLHIIADMVVMDMHCVKFERLQAAVRAFRRMLKQRPMMFSDDVKLHFVHALGSALIAAARNRQWTCLKALLMETRAAWRQLQQEHHDADADAESAPWTLGTWDALIRPRERRSNCSLLWVMLQAFLVRPPLVKPSQNDQQPTQGNDAVTAARDANLLSAQRENEAARLHDLIAWYLKSCPQGNSDLWATNARGDIPLCLLFQHPFNCQAALDLWRDLYSLPIHRPAAPACVLQAEAACQLPSSIQQEVSSCVFGAPDEAH